METCFCRFPKMMANGEISNLIHNKIQTTYMQHLNTKESIINRKLTVKD